MIIVETVEQVELYTLLVKLTLLLYIVAIPFYLGFCFGQFYQKVGEDIQLESQYALDLFELPASERSEPVLNFPSWEAEG